jgi:RsiW-degrading membrane proteinase PrsW (M82 family)
MIFPAQAIFFAFFGGALPASIWLWFWLKEDSDHPEPRGLIVLTFMSGMIAVILVLPFQKIVYSYMSEYTPLTFFIWAALEELFKFGAAYVAALRNKAVDEPIDVIIYMVTAALGFVALENTLFLINPLFHGQFLDGIVTGNLRFIGTSLLHIVSSATVGIFMAFAFYGSKKIKRIYLWCGLGIAIVLHTLFNLSIIENNGSNTFITFSVLWVSVIGLLLFFEKVKKLNLEH